MLGTRADENGPTEDKVCFAIMPPKQLIGTQVAVVVNGPATPAPTTPQSWASTRQ